MFLTYLYLTLLPFYCITYSLRLFCPLFCITLSQVMSAFTGKDTVVDVVLPMDEAGAKSLGFAFVEFKTKGQASMAVDLANGYKLDKKHVFIVTAMADFEKYTSTPDEWVAPTDAEFEEKENLQSWLLNKHCEDQFVIRHDLNCDVNWCRKTDSVVAMSREKWSDTYVAWSPRGTYLATFHKQGIALWGGKKFTRLARFAHSSVKLIDFSPCERYLVTWSSDPANAANPDDPQTIIVWNIKTGEKMRGFTAPQEPNWPVFKWSHDGSMCARLNKDKEEDKDKLSVYTTPSMDLLDKKSLKIRAVQGFSWSPSDNIISYWTPEIDDIPARVELMALPSREVLSAKNIVRVKECKMSWQKSGDHVCISVERWVKSKKSSYTQFMLFHMRETGYPVDLLEMKEDISAFAWEPIGTKFAVLHGEAPRICLSVYDVDDGKVTLLKMVERVTANALYWSPRGRYLVAAGLGAMQG